MKKPSGLEQCFELKCDEKMINVFSIKDDNLDKTKLKVVELFIMRNEIANKCKIVITENDGRYNIVSSTQHYFPNINCSVDILKTRVLVKDGETVFYKSIRLHLREIIRLSDIGPTINRYYGILSNKLIWRYLDSFILSAINAEHEEDFKSKYKSLVEALVININTRVEEILHSIKSDNIPDGCPPHCPVKISDELMSYNTKDIKFSELLTARIKAIGNGSIMAEYINTEIDAMSYLHFYKEGRGIIPCVGGSALHLLGMEIGSFDGYSISRTLSTLIYLYTDSITIPEIEKGILNIVYIKYTNKNNLILLIAGDKYEKIMFNESIGIDTSVCGEILDKLDKVNYKDLYFEKKSIKNLWGLLTAECV